MGVIKAKNRIKLGVKALLFLFLGFILLALFFCNSLGLLDKDGGVSKAVLGAPPCLEKPLELLLQDYYPQGNRPFSICYATPPVLIKQLQNGRNYGVIISGNRKWSNYLQEEGYYQKSQVILGNSLVVVIPKRSELKICSPQEILLGRKLAMADYSHAPIGRYVRKYLQNHDIWQEAKEKVVCAMNDVAALSMVASGSVDMGIVTYSDAQTSQQVKIAYKLQKKVPKIEFEAIVIKNCPKELQSFYDFLVQSSTLEKFENYGFINLQKKESK